MPAAPTPVTDITDGLLSLAETRFGALLAELDGPDSGPTALDQLIVRLFDPQERELLTVSAFSSSL